MPNPGSSKTKMLLFAMVAVVAGVAAIFAPGEKKAEPVKPAVVAEPVPAPTPAARLSKEQAMTALMSLPELKAWSDALEKSSGGTVRGALIEYDDKPKVIDGVSYWQFSFVENGSDAAHRWESFLVAEDGQILVEDLASDKPMSLAQWRAEKKPMERAAAQ